MNRTSGTSSSGTSSTVAHLEGGGSGGGSGGGDVGISLAGSNCIAASSRSSWKAASWAACISLLADVLGASPPLVGMAELVRGAHTLAAYMPNSFFEARSHLIVLWMCRVKPTGAGNGPFPQNPQVFDGDDMVETSKMCPLFYLSTSN